MIKTEGKVWTVVTSTVIGSKELVFHTHFSLWDMAVGFYDRMRLLAHYNVDWPVEVTP
jgi:hypothetical protein